MLKLMPALEAYALANIATQNITGGSPLQFLLGDLNASQGTGGLSSIMGPQPNVITVKELITGEMNQLQLGTGGSGGSYQLPAGSGGLQYSLGMAPTSPYAQAAENFKNSFGNIVIGTVMTTAGFRIANKVLAKPKNKMNAMLRQAGLGSTIQL